MHRILAFSKDPESLEQLQRARSKRSALDVVVAGEIGAAIEALAEEDFDAVLIDDTVDSLDADERAQLLSAGGQLAAVFAVGAASFDELNASAHLGGLSEPEEVLDELEKILSALRALSERPESGAYFVGDTQERSYVDAGGGLDRHTSHFEVDESKARLLYVGKSGDFRGRLETLAGDHNVEVVAFDEPHAVSLTAGAPPIDLVALSVEGELGTARRLIRYLRRHQPEAPFELLLLARAGAELGAGLGRTLGADEVLDHPIQPSKLLDRAHKRPIGARNSGARTRLVVVAPQTSRQNLIRSALSREPIEPIYVADVGEVEELCTAPPDMVLVDGFGQDADAAAVVAGLKRRYPFASTRYLAALDTEERASSSLERFDGVLTEPIYPSDIRQMVRLHLAHSCAGRAALERDGLTDVNSILALGDDLQGMLDEATSTGELVVLTAVDVDNLCQLNARYGRIVGDTVLRSLADALHLASGDRQAIYRTDADEFFVLQSIDESAWLATRDRLDRALRVFRQQTFRSVDGRGTYATASAGCIVAPPVGVSAEYCLQKSWIVLERASATRQDSLLVAQLDPSAVPTAESSRQRVDEHD